jgi:lipoprotein-anchoring transpeptidase ErfK/SrfK
MSQFFLFHRPSVPSLFEPARQPLRQRVGVVIALMGTGLLALPAAAQVTSPPIKNPQTVVIPETGELQPVNPAQTIGATLTPPSANNLLPEIRKHLLLSLSQRTVTLYEGDKVLKTYPVAVGKDGWGTPVGDHKIIALYKNPPWRHWDGGEVIPGGDPDNPLGTRWIGFWQGSKNGSQGTAGFHGTYNRASIGSAASHGCVRMYKENIEELFEMVELGMDVKVLP